MGFVAAVRSECVKLKHTFFGGIHILMPFLGAILFLAYYLLYDQEDPYRKWNLILEITATIFPILMSVVVGLAVSLEEKNCNLQTLLAMQKRKLLLFAKLLVLYGTGIMALVALFMIVVSGIAVKGMDSIAFESVAACVVGLAFCNLFFYVLHLFLQLKFGLGVSLFWGVFECLQCILYSNLELEGGWRFIPFSWSVCWVHDILQGEFGMHLHEWIVIVGITAVALWGLLQWFSRWEGRRGCE